MMVEYTIIALAALSILLLVLSFFAKDEWKPLEEQIDQLAVSLAQETYQMKKRLRQELPQPNSILNEGR